MDFDQEMLSLEPTIEKQLLSFKKEIELFNLVEEVYQKTVQGLDDAQNERWELQRKLGDDRSLFDRTHALVEDKENSVEKLKQRLVDLLANEESESGGQKQLAKDREISDVNLSQAKSALEKAEKEFKKLKVERDAVSKERHGVSAQIQSLKGQKEFYNELVETKEGFPDGTRFVLENRKEFPGILGTVADMFQVDEANRAALESGLGDLSHCLIALDRQAALETLEKREKVKQAILHYFH